MLSMWNSSIFTSIKDRLQSAAIKLLHSERQGDAFDSQLVIGVRESFGMQTHMYTATTHTHTHMHTMYPYAHVRTLTPCMHNWACLIHHSKHTTE